jgi:estrogen-related receptor beta like 1
VKWLLQLNDVQGNDFSKYDDPMTVSTNIQTECKKIGVQCDYPPLKLRSGSGEEVLTLLSQLTQKALKKTNFTFKKPELEQTGGHDEPTKN